jgi:hypothetical protein
VSVRLALTCGAALVLAALGGCSSDHPAPAAAALPRECPASLTSAIAASCVEGQSCPIGYACGAFVQEAQCTCTGGHYACADATGAALTAGASPACVPFSPPGKCPIAKTDLSPCTTAGLACDYKGLSCPENPYPNVDTCTCTGDGDGGLAFHCVIVPCVPRFDGGASDDSGAPDASTD